MLLLAAGIWMQIHPGVASLQTNPARPTPLAPALSLAAATRQFGLKLAVTPDTVTIGQHFTVTVRIRVPAALAGAIQFPPGTETVNQTLTTSDSVTQHRVAIAGGLIEATATYYMEAWDVGRIPIGLSTLAIGTTHVDLSTPTVLVRSVLPTSLQGKLTAVPKPARATFSLLVITRQIVWQVTHDRNFIVGTIVVVVLLIGGGIVWMILARTRERRDAMAQIAWAEREFARIEKLHLLEKGEPERYAILMTNVVRQLLSRQFPTVRVSATTSELVTILRRESTIPATRTLQLLERIDMLKFAKRDIEANSALNVGAEDRAIVQEIKERRQAELEEHAAQQAAKKARAEISV